MDELTKNKAEYLIIFVNEFAQRYKLSSVQAYRYLARFKAINFLIEQYNIAHTQSSESMVSDMVTYCRRHGGTIA